MTVTVYMRDCNTIESKWVRFIGREEYMCGYDDNGMPMFTNECEYTIRNENISDELEAIREYMNADSVTVVWED